jgi:RNA polymerase sigma-70 factor (ECF subfamily)
MISKLKISSWFSAQATEEDFEQFYHAELPRVYNFFRYRFGDDPLAEDLTSETFEKAWQHREKYRRDLSALSTWIFTIARNIAIDHYRKKGNELPLDEAVDLPSDEMTVDELAQQHTEYARLSILLSQLANRERELVALKYGAGLTNRAIAGLSGLRESNVAVILHRAIHTLRDAWEKP